MQLRAPIPCSYCCTLAWILWSPLSGSHPPPHSLLKEPGALKALPGCQKGDLTPLAAPLGAWGSPILPSTVPSLLGLPLQVYVGQIIRLMESWMPLARWVESPPLEPIMVSPLFPAQPNRAPSEPGAGDVVSTFYTFLREPRSASPAIPTMGI